MKKAGILSILFVAIPLAVAVIAEAQQQSGKVPRIGFLSPTNEPSPSSEAFVGGLRELGYVEGRNIAIEYRNGQGRFDRLPELTAELVRLKVDVILAASLQAAKVAKDATRTIPMLCLVAIL